MHDTKVSQEQSATPQCSLFGTCGGCQNQHLSYATQLKNKEERLAYLLKPFYGGAIEVHSGEAYGYRNRMDFIVAERLIGFRQTDERKLVDVPNCPISEPRLNTLLQETRAWLRNAGLEVYDRKKKAGCIKYVVIRVAKTTCISFMLNEDSPKLTRHVDAIKLFAEKSAADNVVIAYTPAGDDESVSLECFAVKGTEFLEIEFLGNTVEFHSQAFFQNNSSMAQRMVAYVAEQLKQFDITEKTVVDAYGGVGTFGLAFSSFAKNVISIESHPLSSEACKKNIQQNRITNMRAVTEDAGNIKKFELTQDAVLVLDPPRSGLGDKMIRYLQEKKHEKIFYVSCNPNQLAKELTLLQSKYTVARAALFDLFPQTNHMEAVITLERKEHS